LYGLAIHEEGLNNLEIRLRSEEIHILYIPAVRHHWSHVDIFNDAVLHHTCLVATQD